MVELPAMTIPGRSGVRLRVASLALLVAGLATSPAHALDALPRDLQRAEEMKLVIEAAAEKLQGLMLVGIERTLYDSYLVWTDECEFFVTIRYTFDESDPLSPPPAEAEVGEMDCSGM
jgi:hypothetical protein